MITTHPIRAVAVAFAACLLAACGNTSPDTDAASTVAVSTVPAVQQQFANSISAIGAASTDPRALRRLSLAHGGEVLAVTASPGEAVTSGQALLTIATDPVTRQAFAQARNALALARRDLAHAQQLASQRLATRGQVDAARNAVADARAALAAQQRLGGGSGTRTVTAPTAGTVIAIDVARGERVNANAPLATFAPADALVARLGVSPDAALLVQPGMTAILHAVYGAMPDARGKVSMVGRAIDPTTHLVPVEVTLPAAWGARLAAGSAVSASIETGSHRAWAVPRGALHSDAQGSYVFQLEHGKAHRVDVKVVAPDGSPVGVAGAFDANAPVITTGSYELADGDTVRIASHAAAQAPGAGAQ